MKPHFPLLLIGAVFAAVACSPREDRPAPGVPLPSDPAGAPAPSTPAPPAMVPKLPDPKAPDGAVDPAARDSKASNPKGDLTSREDSTAMPKPGQANNHSSPSLDPSKGAGTK